MYSLAATTATGTETMRNITNQQQFIAAIENLPTIKGSEFEGYYVKLAEEYAECAIDNEGEDYFLDFFDADREVILDYWTYVRHTETV